MVSHARHAANAHGYQACHCEADEEWRQLLVRPQHSVLCVGESQNDEHQHSGAPGLHEERVGHRHGRFRDGCTWVGVVHAKLANTRLLRAESPRQPAAAPTIIADWCDPRPPRWKPPASSRSEMTDAKAHQLIKPLVEATTACACVRRRTVHKLVQHPGTRTQPPRRGSGQASTTRAFHATGNRQGAEAQEPGTQLD